MESNKVFLYQYMYKCVCVYIKICVERYYYLPLLVYIKLEIL
jgi:hypothetical protein